MVLEEFSAVAKVGIAEIFQLCQMREQWHGLTTKKGAGIRCGFQPFHFIVFSSAYFAPKLIFAVTPK
jgi:hypothetical protein